MASGDIPQVEAEIQAMRGAVLADWRRRGGAALEELVHELEEPSSAARTAAVAAALLIFADTLSESRPSRRFRMRARASAQRLIVSGIRFAELAGGRLQSRGPTVKKASRQVGDELVALSEMRAQSPTFTKRLRRGAQDLDAAAREQAELDRLSERIDRDEKEEKAREERQEEVRRKKREVRKKSREATDDLKKTVRDKNGALSDAIADAWAYRAFNLGVYMAARSVGIRELVAVNPDDERTTPFCHWVNGKTIKVERVQKQVDAFLEAVKGGRREDVIAAWPFLAQNPGALKTLRDENHGSQALGFRRFFAKVGLPPYHFRCRTRAFPRYSA